MAVRAPAILLASQPRYVLRTGIFHSYIDGCDLRASGLSGRFQQTQMQMTALSYLAFHQIPFWMPTAKSRLSPIP